MSGDNKNKNNWPPLGPVEELLAVMAQTAYSLAVQNLRLASGPGEWDDAKVDYEKVLDMEDKLPKEIRCRLVGYRGVPGAVDYERLVHGDAYQRGADEPHLN